MLPIISQRDELLFFYKKLAEEPQGFQRFVEDYAFEFSNQVEFKWGHIKGQTIHICAGSGLNGRYALAIAKELSRITEKKICLYVYTLEYRLSEEFERLIQELKQIQLELEIIDLAKSFILPSSVKHNDLLIDGLAGYEQSDSFPSVYLQLFEALNGLEAIKLSIEVPSGITFSNKKLDTEHSPIFKADYSWGIALPSLKMFLEPYEACFGVCKTLNLSQAIALPMSKFSLIEEEYLRQIYSESKSLVSTSSKVCIVGLDFAYYGCLLILGHSALSAGAREVQVLTHKEACLPIQMQQAEIQAIPFTLDALPSNSEIPIAIGTKLSENPQDKLWEELFTSRRNPFIIGANVSKMIVNDERLLALLPRETCLVLDVNDLAFDIAQGEAFEQILNVQKLALTYGLNFVVLSNRAYICLANGQVLLQGNKLSFSLVKANLEVLTGLILAMSINQTQHSFADKLSLATYIYQEAVTLCQRRRKASIVLSDEIIRSISEVCDTLNK